MAIKNPCEGCEEATPNPKRCIDKGKCVLGKDVVWCEFCSRPFDWKDMPSESITTVKEHHGQPHLRPEEVVTGFVCPECGYKVSF